MSIRLTPLLSLLCCCLLLAGCGTVELYSRLSESETNEMIAILQRHGIAAEKTAGEENTWNIKVAQDHFSEAVETLKSQGYPRDRFVGMGETFKKSGLVSSPAEERIRFMSALSQEIAGTLSQIDGVLTARVHINLPNNDPLVEKLQPSSAAVFIRYRPDRDLQSSALQIKTLVVNSIEGLSLDKVSLAMFPADLPGDGTADGSLPARGNAAGAPGWQDVWSFRVAPQSAWRLQLVLGTLAGLLGLSVLAALAAFWRLRRLGAQAAGGEGAANPMPATRAGVAALPEPG